jgi:hypothetical protein
MNDLCLMEGWYGNVAEGTYNRGGGKCNGGAVGSQRLEVRSYRSEVDR